MSEYPSLSEQAKNLTQFASNVAKDAITSGSLFVSKEVQQERLSICHECEYYDPNQERCKHCGCFLEQKTKFSSGSCPINKWEQTEGLGIGEIMKNNAQEEYKVEIDESNGPKFPFYPNIDDTYSWRDLSWKWDGHVWRLIHEE
jgi:hypothetical protein